MLSEKCKVIENECKNFVLMVLVTMILLVLLVLLTEVILYEIK